jgi:hypothetical protein
MSSTTQRLIPDNYSSADLSAMPDYAEITPEMIDFYVREGKRMRAEMLFNAASAGYRSIRGFIASILHRTPTVQGQVGTPH